MLSKSKQIKFLLVLLISQFSYLLLEAQTVVKGKVTDAQTFEPVVFANVVYKGTSIGVITDFDGNYSISGNIKSDSIEVSFIGYDNKTIGIKPDTVQIVDVQLHPAIYALDEVKVTPGENRAHSLLRKVWKNRETNNIEKLSAYQYENYSRATVFLRKFSNKPDSGKVLKPYSKEFDTYAVKTGEEDIPALPSYTTESQSDNYFLKSPKREYIYIKATNSDGIAFENTDMLAQLVSKQENLYFPDNKVLILDKSFISPVSRFGLMYYKYYLTDSLLLDNKYFCYEINVVPKREEDPVFHGTIWIHDTTYALKRISVEATKKAELNFIQRIKIQQDYEPFGSGAWFPVETRFMADAANIFTKNYSRKSHIVVDQPFDPGFYGSEMKVSFKARDFDEDYWETNRLNSLDRIDSLAWIGIDSLKKNKRIRISAKLVEASIKGYYNFGLFELGPYLLIYNHNSVEGNRFRIGGRTNVDFGKKWIFEAYLAYGTLDKRFKGSLQTEYFLSKERWSKIGIQYRDDIENVGSLDEFYSQSTFLTFATSLGGSDKMDRSQVFRTWLESDIFKGMTGKLVFTYKTFEPVSPDFYFGWYTDQSKTDIATNYTTSELGLIFNYQPKATYIHDGVRRFPVNFNKSPVFGIQYFRGLKDILNSDFSYHKIVADISHSFNLGGIGTFSYDLSFTKVFDQLPYPLLITLAGNQSIFRTNHTYDLMNYGEFVLDEAIEIGMSYHMNGLILNKIPLLKKLQWRTVVTAHAAFGSFNDELNGFYDPDSNPAGILADSVNGNPVNGFYTLSYNKPYAELSYGIENIFRILRVDLIHRLTWFENPDVHRFAVKISGVFRF